MKINFYPDCDNKNFEEAAKEYAQVWAEEGDKIVAAIEKISGLKFKEKIINAVIHEYTSNSNPLYFQAGISAKHKKGTITHELCHRITVGNHVEAQADYWHPNYTLEVHKLTDLILYDVLVELYGEEFAKGMVGHEISLWDGEGISPYEIAWNWALTMTKEERHKEFQKYLAK